MIDHPRNQVGKELEPGDHQAEHDKPRLLRARGALGLAPDLAELALHTDELPVYELQAPARLEAELGRRATIVRGLPGDLIAGAVLLPSDLLGGRASLADGHLGHHLEDP